MSWLKSEYVWVANGEFQRAIENAVIMLLTLIAADYMDGGVDFTTWQWLVAPAAAATMTILAFIKGKLPAKTGV